MERKYGPDSLPMLTAPLTTDPPGSHLIRGWHVHAGASPQTAAVPRPWSAEEERALCRGAALCPHDWHAVQAYVPTRTPEEVREQPAEGGT